MNGLLINTSLLIAKLKFQLSKCSLLNRQINFHCVVDGNSHNIYDKEKQGMKNAQTIKERLFAICEQHVAARIAAIQENLHSIKEARNNETKSTAGDKHETGRAMMQIEERNSQAQLSEALRVKNEIEQINPNKNSDKVVPGSLAKTNNGYYFISIGLGKVSVEEVVYFCVSVSSPIGSQLLHKKVGDTIVFNGKDIRIEVVW